MQNKNSILYIVIIILSIMLIGENVYFFLIKKDKSSLECVNYCGDGNCQTLVSCSGTSCPCAETETNCLSDCKIEATEENKITIDWDEWQLKESIWNILDYNKLESTDNKQRVYKFLNEVEVYKLGVVSKGNYTDGILYLINYRPGGWNYRIIKKDKNIILLDKYSDLTVDSCDYDYGPCWKVYSETILHDDKTEIANLEPAAKVSIPNSEMFFYKDENSSRDTPIADYPDTERLFDFGNSSMYKTYGGCFISKANDGTARSYYFDFGFFQKTEGEDRPYKAIGILDVQWSDGKQNTQEYRAGTYECYEYADYIDDMDRLIEIGISTNGEKFYELKDKNDSELTEVYDNYYPGWDSTTNEQKEKISYEEFLTDHPLVLWSDPFGNFIQFKDIRYASVAEMAKPVIYLYPEQEENISVMVNPSGGFTYTDPEYKNGWKVNAKSNGEIYNYDDGKIYPYLFWEGKDINYKQPEEGFVVARENIKDFLEGKLSQLGLIKKEYDELIEFWLPKMQDKKYYFITFTDKKEIDDGAPLFISPKPDTIIRILMDYQGLDEYKKVKEPKIITPERKGFVVVEWGGVLHK